MPSSCPSNSPSEPRGPHPAVALGLALGFAIAGCMAVGTGAPTAAREEPAAAPPPPAAPARIAFDHRFHLERGPTCLDCHEGADTAEKAGMPKTETCLECHEEIDATKPKEKTIAAFLDGPGGAPRWSGVTAQPGDIRFSHAAHAAGKVGCEECHAGIAKSTAVTADLRLDMDGCVSCHEKRHAPNDCATCHRVAAEGVAAGTGPWWKPANHDESWRTAHGAVARRDSPVGQAERCSTCHGQPGFPERAECARCHATTPPADHAMLWKEVHGQEVRRNPGVIQERCVTCHEPSACLKCHVTEQPRDHTRFWCTGSGHGLAAAMDRTRCYACHRTDACVACHTQVSPRSHRAGWGAPKDRHCLNCHLPLSSPEGSGCAACHAGTPSHATAPPMPSQPPHRVDSQCRQCHGPTLRHADNGMSCTQCHR